MEVRKPIRKRATELNQGAKTRTQISKSETLSRVQQRLDELHKGIQSNLDEHAGFKQLKIDLQTANQANYEHARMEWKHSSKRREISSSPQNRADRECHSNRSKPVGVFTLSW